MNVEAGGMGGEDQGNSLQSCPGEERGCEQNTRNYDLQLRALSTMVKGKSWFRKKGNFLQGPGQKVSSLEKILL